MGVQVDTSERVIADVAAELTKAYVKFGPMASPHEGWAVIREELDELWEHVKSDTGRGAQARQEAIQVAAMALRYAADLCDPQGVKCFNHDTPNCPLCLRWAKEMSA